MFFPITLMGEVVPVQIPQGTGTTIGNATENGGIAAAFDGTTSQDQSLCAYKSDGGGWVGKQYSSAKTVLRWLAWGSSDFGFNNQSANGSTNISLEYSDNGSSWTSADTASVNAVPGAIDRTFTSVGAHTYWRVIHQAGDGDTRIAEVQFWEA